MRIIAVEFSSGVRSVAACAIDPRNGEVTRCGVAVEETTRSGRAIHLVEEALKAAGLEREEIDHLAVGLGPGSYTGIRAALAFAHGWRLGRPVALAGMSSVELLAAQGVAENLRGHWNIIIDAQRREFYLAGYELGEGGTALVEPLRIVTEAEIRERAGRGGQFLGPEADRFVLGGRRIAPAARTLAIEAARRGLFGEGENLEPIYLRETEFVKAPPPRVF
jgi:tRNA threonylcarbamoyl adenosine modification protein YeaZ